MFHKALCQNVSAPKVRSEKVRSEKVHCEKVSGHKILLLILCGIFGLFAHPGWSQTLAHAELPEADTLPLLVVPPSLAQVYQPAATPQLLAFSPDHKTLAFSTNHNTKRQSALGDIWASELHLLALKPQAVAETIINAKTTASFAHYGAPATSLTWQDDKILFVISDGDDEATQLTYLTQQQRLENPNIGEYTLDETPSLTALEASIQQCFADWPAEVVENGMALWVQEGERALYQANYANYPRDIWLIDVPNCQRRLIPVPTQDRGQPLKLRLAGAVLNQAQLVLVLDSWRHPSHPGQTLVLQTSLDRLGTPEQGWDNWSYGLGSSLHFELLTSAQNQKLFLLTDTRKPCRAQLYSLSPQQLRSFMVDAHRLCNAVVDQNGQLGLTLYAYPQIKAANDRKAANRIWVVHPTFLARLAN